MEQKNLKIKMNLLKKKDEIPLQFPLTTPPNVQSLFAEQSNRSQDAPLYPDMQVQVSGPEHVPKPEQLFCDEQSKLPHVSPVYPAEHWQTFDPFYFNLF